MTEYTRDAHTISSSTSNNKTPSHKAQRTSYRHGRRYETGVHVIVIAAAAARVPRYARACTHARYVRYVRTTRTMGKTPATTPVRQSGGDTPRRGCSTARVQHPAVEISGTGLGDAPPERDLYTIKIARVETTYEYDNTTTTYYDYNFYNCIYDFVLYYILFCGDRPARDLVQRSVRYCFFFFFFFFKKTKPRIILFN